MDITFNCEKCGQSIAIDEAGAGHSVECPKCSQTIKVPSQAVAMPSSTVNQLLNIIGVLVLICAIIGGAFAYRKHLDTADIKQVDMYEAEMTASDQKMFRHVKAAVDYAHEMAVNQWFDSKACSNLENYVHAIDQTNSNKSMPHSSVLIDGLDISSAIFDFEEHCRLAYDLNNPDELRMAIRQLDEVDRKYSEFKEMNPKMLQ